jgi:biopolymer transport protein TolR
MAMSLGTGGGAMSEINITPLIDVMLVLLIIFMVIVPVTPNGLEALVPQPPKNPQKTENTNPIVVEIASNGSGQPGYKINETDVSYNDLYNKLQGIFSTRAEKVMFIKGDPQLNWAVVAQVMDIGTAAGVDHVGLITPKVAAGQ